MLPRGTGCIDRWRQHCLSSFSGSQASGEALVTKHTLCKMALSQHGCVHSLDTS